MKTDRQELLVSASIGNVTTEACIPDNMTALLTFAHGAGAGMDHAFMKSMSLSLGANGIGTVRFNFPFTEQKKKRVDPPAVAEKTIGVVLEMAFKSFPTTPILAGGKSFGGRMTSNYLSKNFPDFVRGVIFFGFPLHPAGQPAVERARHLDTVRVPMLFLQGTRDALADMTLITQVCDSLPAATIVRFEGADHSFKAGKNNNITALADATSSWITSLPR